MSPAAVVTGVTGQDGSYLVELLLEKGYDVYGIVRRSTYPIKNSNLTQESLMHSNFKICIADLTDQPSLIKVFWEVALEHNKIEVYNLAAQSHVGVSFDCPVSTVEANLIGTLNLLETIRQLGIVDKTKFYQASTSEMFGQVQQIPQTERTPFYPRSPYGVAKLAAHWMVKNYRETYNLYACCGILFNHESPRRGAQFVTQKIVKSFKEHGRVSLGNLNAKRDWGHAKDYVRAMWLMMQQQYPDDYVVATGEQHSVREFCELAYKGKIVWSGTGAEETGHDAETGQLVVEVDPKFYRPCEVETLIGDASKVREIGWIPEYTFEELVKNMCEE